jgi:hypothetical protein
MDDLDWDGRPPSVSEHFEIEGISFANSIAHPVLGFYWQDFHDRLYWSKDLPIAATEEGINLAFLMERFWDADHRIYAMPPVRDAAQRVWDAVMRQLGPEYRRVWDASERVRGRVIDQISPVIPAPTIHGCKVALANATQIRRKIANIWNSPNNRGGGTLQIEQYVDLATEAAGRAASRFDPTRGFKFTTYAHKFIKGALTDWKCEQAQHPTISIEPPPGSDISSDDYLDFLMLSATEDWRGGSFAEPSPFAPGGQRSEIVVPSDEFSVERIVDRRPRWGERLRKQIKAEANLNLYQEVVFDNLLSGRPRDWKDIAEQLGISAKDEIYVLKARTIKKVVPVLKRLFFTRPEHD